MADKSKIEWTNATWNPVTGCDKVSSGCKNCYAELDWKRLSANSKSVYFGRRFNDLAMHSERLEQPLRWRDPRMIFVNSMSDLFHQDVPREFIARVFAIMAMAKEHTFQILTKRADRLSLLSDEMFEFEVGLIVDEYARERGWCVDLDEWQLPNVWLGVSVENQQAANERIPHLLQTPAAIHWISAEPLLGEVDLSYIPSPQGGYFDARCKGSDNLRPTAAIDWVVAGGESGPNARITDPDWHRSLRDQCRAADVPFFFKQHGEFMKVFPAGDWKWMDEEGAIHEVTNELRDISALGDAFYHRIGKKKAGRILDGRTWDEMPEVRV